MLSGQCVERLNKNKVVELVVQQGIHFIVEERRFCTAQLSGMLI